MAPDTLFIMNLRILELNEERCAQQVFVVLARATPKKLRLPLLCWQVDGFRLSCPASACAREVAKHHRPHFAGTVRDDGDRHGAVQPSDHSARARYEQHLPAVSSPLPRAPRWASPTGPENYLGVLARWLCYPLVGYPPVGTHISPKWPVGNRREGCSLYSVLPW